MEGIFILSLHIILYSGFGVFFYNLRSYFSFFPYFIYLSLLQVFVQLLNSVYGKELGFGISIGGGSIAYAAVLWAMMFLYMMENDPALIKIFLYVLIVLQAFFIIFFLLIEVLLQNNLVLNPLSIPYELFSHML